MPSYLYVYSIYHFKKANKEQILKNDILYWFCLSNNGKKCLKYIQMPGINHNGYNYATKIQNIFILLDEFRNYFKDCDFNIWMPKFRALNLNDVTFRYLFNEMINFSIDYGFTIIPFIKSFIEELNQVDLYSKAIKEIIKKRLNEILQFNLSVDYDSNFRSSKNYQYYSKYFNNIVKIVDFKILDYSKDDKKAFLDLIKRRLNYKCCQEGILSSMFTYKINSELIAISSFLRKCLDENTNTPEIDEILSTNHNISKSLYDEYRDSLEIISERKNSQESEAIFEEIINSSQFQNIIKNYEIIIEKITALLEDYQVKT